MHATPFGSLSIAGFLATAIAYGPARMGFGLFVPQFRDAFSMSSTQVGYVSGLGFLGFFGGLICAQALLLRLGPRAPVLVGLGAATLGMAMIAAAPGVTVLAAGVLLAAASAGFAWTPFNDAVHRKVRDADRATALAVISTGTGIGIAATALAALAAEMTGLTWRQSWAAFAGAGALMFALNLVGLRSVEKSPDGPAAPGWRLILRLEAAPLLAVAAVFGVTSAIYITFAADHVSRAMRGTGIGASVAPSILFVAYGLFGLAGLATDRVRRTVGLARLLRGLLAMGAASMVIVAVLPASWAAVILSAGLQGVHVMMISAILTFWTERLFPALPALGFTTALLFTAAGSVLGTSLAGLLSDAVGMSAMFIVAAALPATAALALSVRHVHESSLLPDHAS